MLEALILISIIAQREQTKGIGVHAEQDSAGLVVSSTRYWTCDLHVTDPQTFKESETTVKDLELKLEKALQQNEELTKQLAQLQHGAVSGGHSEGKEGAQEGGHVMAVDELKVNIRTACQTGCVAPLLTACQTGCVAPLLTACQTGCVAPLLMACQTGCVAPLLTACQTGCVFPHSMFFLPSGVG